MNALVCFALIAFFPRVGELPGLGELDVERRVADLRRDSTPLFWTGVVLAALFFQLSPILTVRRPFPAALLSESQLDAHAHAIAGHRVYLIRQIVVLLKLVGGMFWGASPEVRALIHLPPYAADPGTRRTGAMVEPPVLAPRSPAPALLAIGRSELARGRTAEAPHKGVEESA